MERGQENKNSCPISHNIGFIMKWSKYNLIYESPKHGWLLFNMLSGTFIDLNDDEAREIIESLRCNGDVDNLLASDNELRDYLLSSAIINENGDADNLALLKMRSLMNRFDSSKKKTVIVPTMDCNLRCSYCFIGGNIKPSRMSDEVVERVKRYLKDTHRQNELVTINWFGGEPLLEVPTIKEISEYVLGLGMNLQSEIVTNGVLLTPEIIETFESLRIFGIQITFDGLKETHDEKRVFSDGRGTYDIIMNNLDYLHKYISSREFMKVNIRINVDKDNHDEYHKMHAVISEKYPLFTIYPGVLMQYKSCSSAINCFSRQKDVAEFWAQQYERYGIDDIQYYPLVKGTGACLAENPYSTVIGPEGEQYLCLKDVGDENEVVGNIFDNKKNVSKIVHYAVKTFCYDNDECNKCHAVALCGGGCPNLKYRKNTYNEDHDYCAQFKNINTMKRYLDLHYEIRKKYDETL